MKNHNLLNISLYFYISETMSPTNHTVLVMLDLQKAFDTVDHVNLCKKLRAVGITSVDWFKSYLSCRTQIVTMLMWTKWTQIPLMCHAVCPKGVFLVCFCFSAMLMTWPAVSTANFYSMLMIAQFWFQGGTQITLQTSLVKNLSLVVNDLWTTNSLSTWGRLNVFYLVQKGDPGR